MTTTPATAAARPRQVLPDDIVPRDYVLSLATPSLTNKKEPISDADFKYTGSVHIILEILKQDKPITSITLNAKDLSFSPSSITVTSTAAAAAEVVSVGEVTFDEKQETATLTKLSRPLTASESLQWVLHIANFTGTLNDSLAGFYRSKVTDGVYMAVTQFEAADARRAFPCWDEPARKATFSVTLTIPSDLTALSNMPVTSTIGDSVSGMKTVVFEKSPVMSTYLLAFVVGDFDYVESRTTTNNVLVRVYTPKGKQEHGRHALQVATWTLDYFTEYFGIPYPLPKCDMVAIPDFAAGAMENWGVITYRETALLLDPDNGSVRSKKRIAYVVAHELAHQWFGNLVTMEWWNGLWLNEGFATWAGNDAVSKRFPEWDVWTTFVYDEYFDALELDALSSSHPIDVPVSNPDEINEIFDAISYSKGASVIRMLSDYLGEATFRSGLQTYLKRHLYKNTRTCDLWNALSEATGGKVDVASLMDQWTLVAGYPLIKVTQQSPAALHLTQSKMTFSSTSTAEATEPATTKWWIPMKILTNDKENGMVSTLMNDNKTTVAMPSSVKWVKVNGGQSAVVRVLYEDQMFEKLCHAEALRSMTATDKLGLEGDSFALSKAGLMKTSSALELVNAISESGEQDSNVITHISLNLDTIRSLIHDADDTKLTGLMNKFTIKVFAGLGEKLGWNKTATDTDLTIELRSTVLRQLITANHAPSVAEALSKFSSTDSNKLSSDLWGVVYGAVAKWSADPLKAFDDLLNVYKNATGGQDQRTTLMSCMAGIKSKEVLQKVLDWAMKSGDVRTQDLWIVTTSAGRNDPELTFKWMQENWEWLKKTFANGQFLFGRVVASCIVEMHSLESLTAVQEFFSAHPTPEITMKLKQTIETIRNQITWHDQAKQDIISWLSAHFSL